MMAWVTFASLWDNHLKLFDFFIYDDLLLHIESNNPVQKPIGIFLIWKFS